MVDAPQDQARTQRLRKEYEEALGGEGVATDLTVQCSADLCRATATRLTIEEAAAIERFRGESGVQQIVNIKGDAESGVVDYIKVYRVRRSDLTAIAGDNMDGVTSPGRSPGATQAERSAPPATPAPEPGVLALEEG